MTVLKLSGADVLRSKIVRPGWYELEITDYTEKPAKDKLSMTYRFDFSITEGDFANVPLQKVYSEKALGMMIGLLKALGYEVSEEGGTFELEANQLKGKKIKGKVQNKEYEGKPQNEITDFLPLGA